MSWSGGLAVGFLAWCAYYTHNKVRLEAACQVPYGGLLWVVVVRYKAVL